MSGWFAMNRAMFDHPIFEAQPLRVAAWAWMIATAAWKDTKQDAGGKIVTVKRGQLLTSYRQMSRATGVPMQPLRTLVSILKDQHAIKVDTNTGRLLITICNYEKYQSSGGGSNTAATQGQHSSNTQKEQGNNITNPPTEEADASQPVQVSVVTTAMWGAGKQYLASQGVNNPGSVIGKWLKEYDPILILNAIEMAQRAGTQDPIPYVTQVLKGLKYDRSSNHNSGHSQGRENRADPALEQIARLAGLGEASGHGGR